MSGLFRAEFRGHNTYLSVFNNNNKKIALHSPGHYGIGRAASVTDDSGSTGYRYDARGNTVWQQNVIGTQAYVTQYVEFRGHSWSEPLE